MHENDASPRVTSIPHHFCAANALTTLCARSAARGQPPVSEKEGAEREAAPLSKFIEAAPLSKFIEAAPYVNLPVKNIISGSGLGKNSKMEFSKKYLRVGVNKVRNRRNSQSYVDSAQKKIKTTSSSQLFRR